MSAVVTASEAPKKFEKCKIVVQRANSVSLLLDNDRDWASLGRSLIVYISFTKGADDTVLPKVVKTILNLPILTFGNWGDGTKPISLATAVANEIHHETLGLCVIPAAALTCKMKGKYVQYRDQSSKEEGERLYESLKLQLVAATSELEKKGKQQAKTKHYSPVAPSAFVSPETMFSLPPHEGLYLKFDEKGIPTHNNEGEPLSKSAIKKLNKLFNKQAQRFEKYTNTSTRNTSDSVAAMSLKTEDCATAERKPHESEVVTAGITKTFRGEVLPFPVVFGTYGNRQGLKVDSECGPFFHSFCFE